MYSKNPLHLVWFSRCNPPLNPQLMSVQVPVLGGMLVGCCGSPRGDGLGVPLREHSLLAAAVVALPCAVGLRISCKVEIYTYEASQRIGGRLLPRQRSLRAYRGD